MSGWWGYDGPRRAARPVKDGLRAKSQRGAMGQAWWSRRWIAALEGILDTGRLGRGRSYARRGQVVDIGLRRAGVEAKVQGSRARPYKVTIALKTLDDAVWSRVLDALASEARFSAQLLAGEMPTDVEDAFLEAGTHLFPHDDADLVTDCSCPDWSNPCKHVAAVHYLLGEALDDDPFLLFQLRGRDRAAVLKELAARRAGAEARAGAEGSAEERTEEGAEAGTGAGDAEGRSEAHAEADALADAEPLDADAFWRRGAPLEGLVAPPGLLRGAPSLLRRLGQPPFLAADLLLALGPVYAAVAGRARELAGQAGMGTGAEAESELETQPETGKAMIE